MSPSTYSLLGFLALTATVALVLAKPTPREFDLVDVANKTMCPIEVTIDDNPERIPRRIKFLKCATRPNKMCREHVTHGCCAHHHHGFEAECVEIHDWVHVSFRGTAEPVLFKVPVGCNCLLRESTVAPEEPW